MSHSELLAFIKRGRVDSGFREQLSSLNSPEEILAFIERSGFSFSSEVRGRFLNRWKGVYFCPQAIEVGELCPALVPEGYRNLIHYSQSTCASSELKKEEFNFRSGERY